MDGSPLALNVFEVIQNGLLPLFAFRTFSGSYLSPKLNGNIGFSETLTDNEYFQIVWHSFNIISFKLWNNNFIYVRNNWKSPECAFLIKPDPKLLTALSHPMPLHQFHHKIYLKSKGNERFLTYRSQQRINWSVYS